MDPERRRAQARLGGLGKSWRHDTKQATAAAREAFRRKLPSQEAYQAHMTQVSALAREPHERHRRARDDADVDELVADVRHFLVDVRDLPEEEQQRRAAAFARYLIVKLILNRPPLEATRRRQPHRLRTGVSRARVLDGLMRGLSQADVARELGLSRDVVSRHVRRLADDAERDGLDDVVALCRSSQRPRRGRKAADA